MCSPEIVRSPDDLGSIVHKPDDHPQFVRQADDLAKGICTRTLANRQDAPPHMNATYE
jgi:hypothetical protein